MFCLRDYTVPLRQKNWIVTEISCYLSCWQQNTKNLGTEHRWSSWEKLSKVPTMSNIATVTFTPWNSLAGFTAFAIIQVKFSNVHICLWTFFAYPSNPHLFLATSTHVFPSTIHFNLHTALLPKWWRTFFTHKPMFLSWPWVFLPQPFLQTSYSLTLDIASLIHSIFQNHLHHPEVVDCFIFSLIKYRQKWSCDPWHQKLRDICDTDVCEGRDRVCGCLKSVQIHNLKLTFYTSTFIKSILSNPNVSLGYMITLEIFHLPNLYFRKSINWTWLVFYHFLGSCKMWTHLKDCGKIKVPSWQKGYIFSVWIHDFIL